jgi:DNA-binding transcriptional ArsR family regulator
MDLPDRIENLERRISALESLAVWKSSWPLAEDALEEDREAAAPSPLPDLRQLERLRRREGPRYVGDTVRGAVTYAGSARLGDREVLWASEHGLPEVWDLEPAGLARLLGVLGHPARLGLVRALMSGVRTSQELQDVIGSGSAGQLYHHLKDLISAGLVDQSGRSRYQIAAGRIVPLLVLMAAAGDLAHPQTPQDDPVQAPDHEEG